MKQSARGALITAAVLIILGLVLGGLGFWGMGFNLRALNTEDVISTSFEITEPFRDISVAVGAADVYFLPSADGVCRVECVDFASEVYAVQAENGCLTVTKGGGPWYRNIRPFSIGEVHVTVFLPEADYASLRITGDTGDLEIPKGFRFARMEISTDTGDVANYASVSGMMRIGTDTGDIRVEAVSAGGVELSTSTGDVRMDSLLCEGELSIRVSTGDVELKSISCRALRTEGNTGDLSLQSAVAAETMTIERTSGHVRFEQCDAAGILVWTDSGDVTGTLLTDKVFLTETNTGDVDVPRSAAGGTCEVITTTGDISLRIEAQ